jgi:hypothetical protein
MLNLFQIEFLVITHKKDASLKEVTNGARPVVLSVFPTTRTSSRYVYYQTGRPWGGSQKVSDFLYRSADVNDLLVGVISLHQ